MKRRLYLEWYSQNGRVLVELADPILWIRDASSKDKDAWIELPEQSYNEECLAPEPIQNIEEQRNEDGSPWFPGCDRRDDSELSSELFIEEMDLMERIVSGEEPGLPLEPVISEFTPSEPLEELSDAEAESAVKVALAQLAMRGIAVHVCEHYSQRDILRYLRRVVADEGTFHPTLGGSSSFVSNYMTGEGCPECEAQLDKELADWEISDPSPE